MRKLRSRISHDHESDRAYLIEMDPSDFPAIIPFMEELADANGYSKLFAKVPAKYLPAFLNSGYLIEAFVPCFYDGKEDAVFLVKYFSEERKRPEGDSLEKFQQMLLIPPEPLTFPLDTDYDIRALGEPDVRQMVTVFCEVFETYPFPIFDPEFIIKTMDKNSTYYFGAFFRGNLVAISSAECCCVNRNAEMTDFAVVPEHRGRQLALHLLSYMEKKLFREGFITLYTIARLNSLPMNKTFYRMGYKYLGSLINNTQISGKIESMNVWYKIL
ncbi:MAG TPA: putative beta-lysine N-acetyltransferase [Prolixibacteraceae bacterium]|nr:putative beta-lysine N-acetyltransferase [Prolixibacteraceae bacterium]